MSPKPKPGAVRVITIPMDYNVVYALAGDGGVVLIDSGPDFEGAWEELTGALRREGFAPSDVRAVVLTHHHVDHASLARRWQDEVGAEILAARGEERPLIMGSGFARSQSAVLAGFLIEQGVPREQLEALGPAVYLSPAFMRQDDDAGDPQQIAAEHGSGRRRPPSWRTPLRMTPVTPDTLLDDGATFERCGVELRTIICPGHTPSNAVFYHEPTASMFSGDHILARITPNPGIHFPDGTAEGRLRSLPAYLRSLEKVRGLPARRILPGHGESMDDLPAAIDRILLHHTKRAERIAAFLGERPHTGFEMVLRLFPHIGMRRIRQTMAETVGHLDALVEEGLAIPALSDGVVRYEAAAGSRSGAPMMR